jgi:hypothetical protein
VNIGFQIRTVTIDDIKDFVNTLIRINIRQMKRRRMPRLYESGIRYRREKLGNENWQTIEQLTESRYGDCEDLVAARVAELRMRGIRAQPWFSRRGATWHVFIKLPSGKIEDPSALLGMNKN